MNVISGRISRVWAKAGFTLIELLVVIVIIAILVAIAFPVMQGVTAKGKMVKEVNAGRTLITGYLAAATDQDGQLPGGYDRSVTSVTMPDGTSQGSPICNRYPFRLLPYIGKTINGTILVNDNVQAIKPNDNYMISCYPAFGINYIFVGGDVSNNGTNSFPGECISRQGTAEASPLVFASAAGDTGNGGKINGYCLLTPPQTTGQMWSTSPWKKTSPASDYGNVDARHTGKAVCVFFDGSIKQLGVQELRDMRLWSRNAALADDANYVIPPTPTQPR